MLIANQQAYRCAVWQSTATKSFIANFNDRTHTRVSQPWRPCRAPMPRQVMLLTSVLSCASGVHGRSPARNCSERPQKLCARLCMSNAGDPAELVQTCSQICGAYCCGFVKVRLERVGHRRQLGWFAADLRRGPTSPCGSARSNPHRCRFATSPNPRPPNATSPELAAVGRPDTDPRG